MEGQNICILFEDAMEKDLRKLEVIYVCVCKVEVIYVCMT